VGEPGASVLAVLTRAPSSGGKSRLFGGLGLAPDPALLEALLLDTLEGTVVEGVDRVVAVTPGDAVAELQTWLPADIGVVAQMEGDLGARMSGVMSTLFATGARSVALVGSDLPEISAASIAEAFAALANDRDQLVLGPSTDGGYYLIAATHVPPVFRDIAWGSPTVFDETVSAAERRGIAVHRLPSASDVDTPEDLRRAADSGRARRTARWVDKVLGGG